MIKATIMRGQQRVDFSWETSEKVSWPDRFGTVDTLSARVGSEATRSRAREIDFSALVTAEELARLEVMLSTTASDTFSFYSQRAAITNLATPDDTHLSPRHVLNGEGIPQISAYWSAFPTGYIPIQPGHVISAAIVASAGARPVLEFYDASQTKINNIVLQRSASARLELRGHTAPDNAHYARLIMGSYSWYHSVQVRQHETLGSGLILGGGVASAVISDVQATTRNFDPVTGQSLYDLSLKVHEVL